VASYRQPLYDKAKAQFLRGRESPFKTENQEKTDLIRQRIGDYRRLVDVGCGWGQLLSALREEVPDLWGLDESRHRLKGIRTACPEARVLIGRADSLALRDNRFDVVVTSQMLHEVKLFGGPHELPGVLAEIRRVLVAGGRYFLLDHADAGEGEVLVGLPEEALETLEEFQQKFRYRRCTHAFDSGGRVRMTKRCLQDFISKDWSLNSPMESMEMAETHNVFARVETIQLVEASGFSVSEWIPFSHIQRDLDRMGARLISGEEWFRKFLLVATKL
jgi:ubiquinone/menaquinone biosynthesis C-methylase UbiE